MSSLLHTGRIGNGLLRPAGLLSHERQEPPKVIKLLHAWSFFCTQVLRAKTVNLWQGEWGWMTVTINYFKGE